MATAPLAGFTVLSFGGSLAASLAARLLADQGAALLLATSPIGTAAGLLDCWLSKGGRVAGPGASADIVVKTHVPGALSNGAAGAPIHVVLRGFAADDPQGRADWPCDDGLAGAAAGLFTDVNPFGPLLGLDPIYTALPLPSVYAAVHAATAAVMAILQGQRGGPPERVEVTLHGAMLSAMSSVLLQVTPQPGRYDIPPVPRPFKHTLLPVLRAAYRYGGPRRRSALLRLAEVLIPPLMDSYRCADGRLLYVLAMDHARMPLTVLRETELEAAWWRAGFVERDPYMDLRRHPVAFLRDDLRRRGMVACADLKHLRDGRRVIVPGIVLMRQKPGSAKGVMFITLEDETGVANLVLWPDRYAAQRRLVLSASMLACHGKVQREGDVLHVIADRLEDLSEMLRSVGERDGAASAAGSDPRWGCTTSLAAGTGMDAANLTSQTGGGIRVLTQDFR